MGRFHPPMSHSPTYHPPTYHPPTYHPPTYHPPTFPPHRVTFCIEYLPVKMRGITILIVQVSTSYCVYTCIVCVCTVNTQKMADNLNFAFCFFYQFFWMAGALGIVGIAWLTVPHLGWRYLLVFAAVPVTLMLFIVPVSDKP